MFKYLVIYFCSGQKYIKVLSDDFTLFVTRNSLKLVNNGKADYFLLAEIEKYEITYFEEPTTKE